MSALNASQTSLTIPIILLKTRSQPYDTYEEYLSSSSTDPLNFTPQFIPVLEHKQNEKTLSDLGQLLADGSLTGKYGGMIFTSQRAVEAWSDVVLGLESVKGERQMDDGADIEDRDVSKPLLNTYTRSPPESQQRTAIDTRSGEPFQTDILSSTPFPLYVVGPATARALSDLTKTCAQNNAFLTLNPQIYGAHTGSGAVLAPFILTHYNTLHSHTWFTFHDAPRLPFIPLLGMGSENYSRRRLESDDPRLQKRGLLFLVGETRRDIIPRTLMDHALGEDKVNVDEVEVYSTVVRDEFKNEFSHVIDTIQAEAKIVVIVVFSPQGAGDMLSSLGYIDTQGLTEKARDRWSRDRNGDGTLYVIVTIGPTTRDYLRNQFSIEPDVCAKKPSPEGVLDGVRMFLETKGLV